MVKKTKSILWSAVAAGAMLGATGMFASCSTESKEVATEIKADSAEHKCGEKKCGASKDSAEAKCGEHKCGTSKDSAEAKCGEGKCGTDKK